jgi:hypothetical protein
LKIKDYNHTTMKAQNYNNHIRFYPPHHFVFYPLMLALLGIAAYYGYEDKDNRPLWMFICILLAVIIWVAFMLRQHYALTLQNRIVLLELRYRYFMATGQRLEPLEAQLSETQLFALRFAPDNELQALTERAVKDKLPADAIKKEIKNWLPDHKRV